MPKDVTVFLVTHDFATDARSGGGQRTMLFFEAAKKVARTEVIVLGINDRPGLRESFRDPAAFHFVKQTGFPERASSRLRRVAATIRRLAGIRRGFAPDPQLRRDIEALAHRPGLSVFLVRYAYPFMKMGMVSDPAAGRLIAVDLDDLDDRKYETESRRRFGTLFTQAVMGPLVLTPLHRMLSRGLRGASTTWVCAQDDARAYPGITSQIVPNVPYAPSSSALMGPGFPAPSTAGDVLFVGSARHLPNQHGIEWFLKNCWPALGNRFFDCRLRIVGNGDWGFLRERFSHLDRVHFGGSVPDLATEYAGARLAISPVSLGAGTKIKVVEACAYGRPVVVTSHSARGFEREFAGHMAVADSPQDFIDACARLLSDPAWADTTGAELQAAQTVHFSFDAATAKIAADLRAMIDAHDPDHAVSRPEIPARLVKNEVTT